MVKPQHSTMNNNKSIDSALLSAMRDNRERMNLLKLEQTLLEFMQRDHNTTEKSSAAANTNSNSNNENNYLEMNCARFTSFHRLVLHRLADRFSIVREVLPGHVIRLIKTESSSVPSKLLIDLNPKEYAVIPSSASSSSSMIASSSTSSSAVLSSASSNTGVVQQDVVSGAALQKDQNGVMEKLSNLKIALNGVEKSKGSKKMMIMKRGKGGSSGSSNDRNQRGGRRSSQNKSTNLSDKEKAYEEARARIFGVEAEASGVVTSDNAAVIDGGNRSCLPSNCSSAFPSPTPSPYSSSPTPEDPPDQPQPVPPNNLSPITPKSNVKGAQSAATNASKVTWRNRKEEEADPDFRRRSTVPLYTSNYAGGVSYISGDQYMLLQPVQPGQVYAYSQDMKAPLQHQQNVYNQVKSPNMYSYSRHVTSPTAGHYPQTAINSEHIVGNEFEPHISYALSTSMPTKPQDVGVGNSLGQSNKIADVYNQEEFPALKS